VCEGDIGRLRCGFVLLYSIFHVLYSTFHIPCVIYYILYSMCMTSVLANRIPLRSVDLREKKMFRRNIRRKSPPRGSILFANTEVMHTGRDQRALQIDIRNSYKLLYRNIIIYHSPFVDPPSLSASAECDGN